jgi:chromate transport protein ChrA
MTDAAHQYFRQLAVRLRHAGIDGHSIGDLIAELAEHLDDTHADPVDEFGPVPEFAGRLIAERRVGQLVWWRRVALPTLGVILATIGAAVLITEPTTATWNIAYRHLIRNALWILAAILIVQTTIRLLRQDRWQPPLSGLAAVLILQLYNFLFHPLGWRAGGLLLSFGDRLTIAGIGFGAAILALLVSRNPVRFPNHFDWPTGRRSKTMPRSMAAVIVIAVLAGAFLVWVNSSSRVQVLWVYLDRSTTVNVRATVNSCMGDLTVSVLETTEEVRVGVFDQRPRIRLGGGACADITTFPLTEPLGNRPLIDQATGQPIRILPEQQAS